MATGAVAALIAVLALGFIEGLGRFYPAHSTWRRLRRRRGRLSVRLMRERFEEAADKKSPRRIALGLLALVAIWVAAARALDKEWYEVLLDVLPYVFVSAALLRTPTDLGNVAERMREYEKNAGEDPDKPIDELPPDEDEGDVLAL